MPSDGQFPPVGPPSADPDDVLVPFGAPEADTGGSSPKAKAAHGPAAKPRRSRKALRPLLWSLPFVLIGLAASTYLIGLTLWSRASLGHWTDSDYASAQAGYEGQKTLTKSGVEPWVANYNLGTTMLREGDTDGGIGLLRTAKEQVPTATEVEPGRIETYSYECQVRINLALGIEIQGDAKAASADWSGAATAYSEAKDIISPCQSPSSSQDQSGDGEGQSDQQSGGQGGGGGQSDQQSGGQGGGGGQQDRSRRALARGRRSRRNHVRRRSSLLDSAHRSSRRRGLRNVGPSTGTALGGGEGGTARGLGDRAGLDVVEPVELGLQIEDVALEDELPRELALVGTRLEAGDVAQCGQGRAALRLDHRLDVDRRVGGGDGEFHDELVALRVLAGDGRGPPRVEDLAAQFGELEDLGVAAGVRLRVGDDLAVALEALHGLVHLADVQRPRAAGLLLKHLLEAVDPGGLLGNEGQKGITD